MFVDQVKISVQAGDGGDGCVSFRREKFVPHGGPNGGDGGRGGDVIFRVNSDLRTLLDFRYRQLFKAHRGEHGKGSNQTGKDGDDVIIFVPRGTIVRDLDTGSVITDLVTPDQQVVVARGGKGGRGNTRFATPTKQAPRQFEYGGRGEKKKLQLELRLLADVGLVGLPNVGKSTLLSRLSAAKPKIADYPFTTLSPNLGMVSFGNYKQFVIADIPGLIEGAHEGKGLGIQFLNHIRRTKVLVLLIDCQSGDYARDFRIIENELRRFSDELLRKPKILAITKIDILADAPIKSNLPEIKDIPICYISSLTAAGLPELVDQIVLKLSESNQSFF